MPPRGVYKARQQEIKTRKADRKARPAQESRSDQRQREQQERENAQRIARESKARLAKALASSKTKLAKKISPVSAGRIHTSNQPSGTSQASAGMKADIIKLTSKKKIQEKINKDSTATTSAKAKMSPPLPAKKFTITGGKISTYSGGESGLKTKSNIYRDPNTGSTIATKEARTNIAQGKDYNIIASTASKTLLGKGVATPTTKERPGLAGTSLTGMKFDPTLPSISAGQIIGQKPKPKVTAVSQTGITHFGVDPMEQKQKDILTSLNNPSQTKVDLLYKTPIKKTPTLLSSLRKKKDKRGMSGGDFWSAMIRTLLG